MIKIKRIYDPVEKSDGYRLLVDRLWPRGIKKERAAIDAWAKELAPSRELLQWFHSAKETRFSEFKKRYRAALQKEKRAHAAVLGSRKRVTLVTAVKDIDHSHIPTLSAFLERLSK